MKNVLYKSMFVLLLYSAVTSFGMEPFRRSASDALGQQENSKRQKINSREQIAQGTIQVVRPIPIRFYFVSTFNYQNQSYGQMMPFITSGDNESLHAGMVDLIAATHASHFAVKEETFRNSCGSLLFPPTKKTTKIEKYPRLKNHIDAGLAQGIFKNKIADTWKPEAGEPTISGEAIARYALRKNGATVAMPSLLSLNKIERCARLKKHIDAGLEQGISKYAIAKAWKPEAGEPTITHKAIGSYLLKKNNAAAATPAEQQVVDDSVSDNGTITDMSDDEDVN